ncbi:hypothetical protein HYN56_10050 [Flavobacterium crocinum]|uniref:Uncharacterized protein n=1 Tax=Flavobacterium crocinum TaxID=2183896 RepID=A0A2S1YKI4_9FLAO|nr:hypothetical protein [Flavobacterium crocinum]AWK04552.1 hypothetical protein HYN56_10050 [Flavobacterium crocinum]
MGVNIYLKSFKKNEKTIISHLKSLDIYDGNDDEIDNYKIEEQVISNLEIIEVVVSYNLFKSFYDINIFLTLNELAFYNFAYSPISGDGLVDNSIVCFDSKTLLVPIEKLILMCENWYECANVKIDVEYNLKHLKELKKFVESSIEKGSFVTVTIG